MMTDQFKRLILLVTLFVGIATSACARPAVQQTPSEPPVQGDTIEVMSHAMGRSIKNTVIVPSQYFDNDLQDMPSSTCCTVPKVATTIGHARPIWTVCPTSIA